MAPLVCTTLYGCSLSNLGGVWLAFGQQEYCRRAAVWHWWLDHKKPYNVYPGLLEHFLRESQPVIRSPTTLRPTCCEKVQASHTEKLGQKRMMFRQSSAILATPTEVLGGWVKPPSWTCSPVDPLVDSMPHTICQQPQKRSQLSPYSPIMVSFLITR